MILERSGVVFGTILEGVSKNAFLTEFRLILDQMLTNFELIFFICAVNDCIEKAKTHTCTRIRNVYSKRKWSQNGFLQSETTNRRHESA